MCVHGSSSSRLIFLRSFENNKNPSPCITWENKKYFENHPKIVLLPVLIFWGSIPRVYYFVCVYMLLTVVSHCDLSVLFKLVMCFQKI